MSIADNSWYYVDDGDRERGHDFKRIGLIDDGFIFTPRLVRLGTVTKDVALWPQLLAETLDGRRTTRRLKQRSAV